MRGALQQTQFFTYMGEADGTDPGVRVGGVEALTEEVHGVLGIRLVRHGAREREELLEDGEGDVMVAGGEDQRQTAHRVEACDGGGRGEELEEEENVVVGEGGGVDVVRLVPELRVGERV